MDAKLRLDDVEYDISTLSDEAKALVESIRFTETELKRVEALAAVLKTAHSRYVDELKELINE